MVGWLAAQLGAWLVLWRAGNMGGWLCGLLAMLLGGWLVIWLLAVRFYGHVADSNYVIATVAG